MTGSTREPAVRFGVAAMALGLGVLVAASRFPGGFDWGYTVVSRLASPRHNPSGAPWVCASLLVAVAVLWPVTGRLAGPERWAERPVRSIACLRVGLIGAALLGLEGLFALDFSGYLRKGHEIVAVATFIGLYAGVLGLYLHQARRETRFSWPGLLVILPLVAVGTTQLLLYFDQRDLGWVNTSWRELGVPLWLSFAFWQWLAVALLGAGLGHQIISRGGSGPPQPLDMPSVPSTGRR